MKKYLKITLTFVSMVSISIANEPNIDRPGNDYNQLGNLRNASVCEQKCQIDNRCLAWTFVKPDTIQGPKSHCYLKDSIPEKVVNNSCISGVIHRNISISFDELQTFIAANGRDITFTANGTKAIGGYECIETHDEECLLRKIANKVNQQGSSKLYISVVRKANGKAKNRVEYLKERLAKFNLSPSKYHVQKVDKKDKHRTTWLSKNKQLWIRVVKN